MLFLLQVRSDESLFSVSYLLVQIMQVFVLGLLANEIKFQVNLRAFLKKCILYDTLL